MENHIEREKGLDRKGLLKFLIGSIIGIGLFMVPVTIDGEMAILFTYIGFKIVDFIGIGMLIGLVLSIVSALGSLYFTLFKRNVVNENLKEIFVVSPVALVIRFLAVVIVGSVYFGVGPEYITSEYTGGFIVGFLMPQLIVFLFMALALIPLLLEYGAMEMIGAILKPVLKPLFKLPGMSAILVLGSWIGSGTIGIISTDQEYQKGRLTSREASILVFGFCTIALPPTFIYSTLFAGLNPETFPFLYFTIIVSTVVSTMIISRIPPLSQKPETYINSGEAGETGEVNEQKLGFRAAVERAKTAPNPLEMVKNAGKTYVPMILDVIPAIVVIATVALALSEFTAVFDIMSKPFTPILNAIGLPEADQAGTGLFIGFVDLLLPFLVAGGITSQLTKFVICTVGIIQVICLSETGIIAMKSKIGISMLDLVVVVLMKTVITVPIALIMGRLIGLS
jgi:nucleoside recognition membrane protein YjiH